VGVQVSPFNQLEKNEIRCRFGDKITYYTERNSGPTIVFISPSACTYEIWKWLIPNFYKQYNIIISCFRGLDTIITEQTGEPVEFNSQESANDIEEILINESIEKAHVVGYCTSVDEALILNSKKSEMIMSLVLISGEYAVEGNQPPKYTKDLYDIFSMINENPGMAPIFVKTMLQNEVEVSDSDLRDLSLNSYPKHHSKFIRFTQTDEYLVNYCKYVNKKIDEDRLLEIVKNVNRPVLVISSKNDNTIDYKQSIWATENINEAKHYCFNVETHYLIIESPHETSKTMNHFFRGIAKE
jgi:pimeloyl-ACP methyl ester carboxylesterase